MISPLIAATQSVAESAASLGPIDLKTALLITLVVVTAVLIAVTRKLTRLHRRIEVLETTAPFPAKNTDPTTTKNGAIPPETVAAISAAIHTTLRGRHRILSVGEINVQRQAWSLEGRRQVFSSHKVR